MSCGSRWSYPDIHWLRAAVIPAVVFIAACLDRGYQTDYWHHLARGREIVQNGRILNVDAFSCTVGGREIRDANWLAQVIFFRLHQWGGLDLVQAINALTLALTLAMVYRLSRRAGASSGISAIVSAFSFFGLWQTFLIRPQSFSLLLFVLLYHVLSWGSAAARLILCPLILGIWCNLHGGFPIGLVLIAPFTFAELCRGRFSWIVMGASAGECAPTEGRAAGARVYLPPLTLLLSFCATLANPYGWRIYAYAATLTSRAASRGIEEWLPPHANQWLGFIFFVSVVLLPLAYAIFRRRPRLLEICIVVLFLPPAFRSLRMTAWWFLATAPIFARLMAAGFPVKGANRTPSIAAGVLTGLLGLCAILSLPCLEPANPLFGSVRSAHRLEQDLQTLSSQNLLSPGDSAAVFTRLEWGEYLDWSLGPTRRIFMDGRIEIFPDRLWEDYRTVTVGKTGWQQILDRYAIDYLVLDGTYHAELIAQVRQSAHWEERARSGQAVLFRRSALSGLADGR